MIERQTQLFYYSAQYYTPSDKKVYINGVTRGRLWNEFTTLEKDAALLARVNICANPKRKVARGMGGIEITRLEPAGPIEYSPYA
jgi:hypothetical protein